jgi:uncharacterized membrane protein
VDLNRPVAYALRVGVAIGAALAAIGLGIWAAQGFDSSTAITNYTLGNIVEAAITGNASGIVYLGIVVLIATPVVRVVLSLVYFLTEKDAKYVGITAVVLAMLLFALFSGRIA